MVITLPPGPRHRARSPTYDGGSRIRAVVAGTGTSSQVAGGGSDGTQSAVGVGAGTCREHARTMQPSVATRSLRISDGC
jgi:hypothetical protein